MRSRLIPLGSLLALLVAGLAAPAHANTVAGGTIKVEVQLPDPDGGFITSSKQDMIEFFNLTSCVCGTEFGVKLSLLNATGTSTLPVEVWVGTSCDTAEDKRLREAQCTLVTTFLDADTLKNPQTLAIDTGDLMYPNQEACDTEQVTRGIYVLIEDSNDNDNVFESVFSQEIFIDTQAPPAPINGVALPGEASAVITWEQPEERQDDLFRYQVLCQRADGSSNADDKFPRGEPEYQTPDLTCPVSGGGGTPPADADAGVGPDAGTTPDAGPSDAGPSDAGTGPDAGPTTTGLLELNPKFVCGTGTGTETSIRVDGLANGVTYRVVLVSIDAAQNPTSIDLGTVTPAEVKDFWEDYHDKGGKADGGMCLISSTYGGDHPFTTMLREFRDNTLAHFAMGRWAIDVYYEYVAPMGAAIEASIVLRVVAGAVLLPVVGAVAVWQYGGAAGTLALLLGVFMLMRGRRRRRQGDRPPRRARRRFHRAAAAAVGAMLVIGVAARVADARPYTPYWDDFDGPPESIEEHRVRWNASFKLGPYLPGIDNEFTLAEGEKGPFELMFRGNTPLMGILELERFFWYPAGQLGITTSAGYTSKTASSYAVDAMGNVIIDPGTMEPERSASDKTKFRMLPVSVGVVYRFTALDDRFGIPIVPYGKAGLSYYMWWITNPANELAEVPDMECPDLSTGCNGDRARGASLGVQASLGISIRAERLDSTSESNLRNEMGIYHIGFFAEATWAKVDGFGKDSKLNVGDLTWFAGMNFEF